MVVKDREAIKKGAYLWKSSIRGLTPPPTVSQFRGSATPIKLNLFSMFYYTFFLKNYVTEPHEHYSVFVKKAYNI